MTGPVVFANNSSEDQVKHAIQSEYAILQTATQQPHASAPYPNAWLHPMIETAEERC